jgi:hypothetical protein
MKCNCQYRRFVALRMCRLWFPTAKAEEWLRVVSALIVLEKKVLSLTKRQFLR